MYRGMTLNNFVLLSDVTGEQEKMNYVVYNPRLCDDENKSILFNVMKNEKNIKLKKSTINHLIKIAKNDINEFIQFMYNEIINK